MLQKCNGGFTLLEYLFSFSIWMIITLTFIPLSTHLLKQMQEAQEDKHAYQLFYEYLQSVSFEGHIIENELVLNNKPEFTIKWEDDTNVCLSYINVFNEAVEICERY